MTKKQFLRVVAFSLVLVCMFVFLCDLFENGESRLASPKIRTYYDLEDNTLDMAMVGTSGIDRYWLAPKAYDERGLASYALASDGVPSWLLLPLIKDITRKNEDLKLLVIDMRPFVGSYSGQELTKFDIRARYTIDSLPFFSLARFESINRVLELTSENFEDASRFDISYLVNFIRYHSRWSEDGFSINDELDASTSEYMGAFIQKSLSLRPMAKPAVAEPTDRREALDPICMENLYELFDYLSQQDYEVLFLKTPHGHKEYKTARFNELCDILDKEGYNYLNCDLDPEIYDAKNDFYNADHVNYYGSEKFTEWFTDYIYENYELPDHRGDDRYYQWEGVYDKIKETISHWEDLLRKREELKKAKEAAGV